MSSHVSLLATPLLGSKRNFDEIEISPDEKK